jgi:phenylacetate-CoA ligase
VGAPLIRAERSSAPGNLLGAIVELSVIVPCLNEAANLPELVSRLARVLDQDPLRGRAELVLVDDGSTDATWPRMQDARARHKFVVTARHQHNRGLAGAWRTGIAAARGRLVCVLDGDLQYRPEEIPRLLERAGGAGDIVQGYRSATARARGPRFIISRATSAILNTLFAMSLPDNKSGFFVCERSVFADLLAHRRSYRYWQLFVMVAAHTRGYRIIPIETPFDQRRAGKSFLGTLPLRPMLRACVDLGNAVLEYRLGIG